MGSLLPVCPVENNCNLSFVNYCFWQWSSDGTNYLYHIRSRNLNWSPVLNSWIQILCTMHPYKQPNFFRRIELIITKRAKTVSVSNNYPFLLSFLLLPAFFVFSFSSTAMSLNCWQNFISSQITTKGTEIIPVREQHSEHCQLQRNKWIMKRNVYSTKISFKVKTKQISRGKLSGVWFMLLSTGREMSSLI